MSISNGEFVEGKRSDLYVDYSSKSFYFKRDSGYYKDEHDLVDADGDGYTDTDSEGNNIWGECYEAKTVYYIDPRLTGTFELVSITGHGNVYHWGFNVVNKIGTATQTGTSGVKIKYTPSAQDLQYGVYYGRTSISDVERPGYVYNYRKNSVSATTMQKVTGSITLTGTTSSGFLLCLGDMCQRAIDGTSEAYAMPRYSEFVWSLERGPYTVQAYYDKNTEVFTFDNLNNSYRNFESVYTYGGFLSQKLTGKLSICGNVLDCSTGRTTGSSTSNYGVNIWGATSPSSGGDSRVWYNYVWQHFSSLQSSYPAVTITYTPTAEDLAKGLRYGYITNSKNGKITNWITPTTTDPITINCTWYAFIVNNFPDLIIDPTSSFAAMSVSKYYGDPTFSAGFTTDSDGTITYSSSNPSVVTISTDGTITIVGAGTTIITAATPLTTAYTADSKTMTLTVSKGNLTVKTSPTPTTINYGQKLSISVLSGGSAVNSSGSNVGGSWSWKSPETFPSAGTISCTVVFVPTDTVNYNY